MERFVKKENFVETVCQYYTQPVCSYYTQPKTAFQNIAAEKKIVVKSTILFCMKKRKPT